MQAQTEATVQRLQAEAKFKVAETEEQLRFKAEEARESQREHERQVELEKLKARNARDLLEAQTQAAASSRSPTLHIGGLTKYYIQRQITVPFQKLVDCSLSSQKTIP